MLISYKKKNHALYVMSHTYMNIVFKMIDFVVKKINIATYCPIMFHLCVIVCISIEILH